MVASDTYDTAILTNGSQNFIVALGPDMNTSSIHSSYTVSSINFSNPSGSGSGSTAKPDTGADDDNDDNDNNDGIRSSYSALISFFVFYFFSYF